MIDVKPALMWRPFVAALIVISWISGCQVAPLPPRPETRESISKLEEKAAGSYQIIALLPLSGDRSHYGNDSLKGIQLAMESVKRRQGYPPIELVILDTAEGGARFKETLSLLFTKLEPLAVIGPMFSREVQLLAGLSRDTAVPFITPTAMLSDVRKLSPYLFSTAFTVELQAERLVDYALLAGYRRFCVFTPEAGLGRELSRVFGAEVQRRGGEIISEEVYLDTETDFRNQIQHLKTVDLRRYGKIRGKKPTKPTKTTKTTKGSLTQSVYTPGFDAIFLPGEYRQAVLIASQLIFHGVKVPLLGSNAWHSQDVARFPDGSMEGGIFIDSFFAESADAYVHDFVEQYRTVYHSEPLPIAAQSYEATRLVLEAVHQGARSGSAVRDFLGHSDNLPVFMGSNGFRPNGILNRKGFMVQIASNGKFNLIQARTVQGEVITIKGETFVIRDGLGKEVRFRVDPNSKVQGVAKVGDRIEAKIIEGGMADSITRK